MSIFADLGLETVKVNTQNTLPDGSYVGFVSNVRTITKKDGNVALVLTYTVDDDSSEQHNQAQDEWRTFPRMVDIDGQQRYASESDEKNAVFLKQRLLSLGISDDEIAVLDVVDLVGIPISFTVATNKTYKNVRNVVRLNGNAEANGSNGLSY